MKKNKKRKQRDVRRAVRARKASKKFSKSRRQNRRDRPRDDQYLDIWKPSWQSVRVGGRKIRGLVYLATPEDSEYKYIQSVGIIDPVLPVAKIGNDFAAEGIKDHPGIYDSIPEKTRATYLDWLVDRNSTEYSTKYVTMYFTGLEKRFLIDHSPRPEKKIILAEVERLLDIYAYDESIKFMLSYFIGIARLILRLPLDVEPSTENKHVHYTAVIGRIGMKAIAGENLNGQWLLNWYVVQTRLTDAVCRIFPEFKAQFISLCDEKYPRGIDLDFPEYELDLNYRPASFGFPIPLYSHIGYVGEVDKSQLFSIANEIAAEARESLDRFRRFLGRYPERRSEMAAHVLLPYRIRKQFPNDRVEKILAWSNNLQRGTSVTRLEEVIEIVHGAPAERITRSQTISLIDALATLLIGVAPDPRLTKYSPKLNDMVIVYSLGKSMEVIDDFGETYWNVFRQMAIACFVKFAINSDAKSDHHALDELISNDELTPSEKIRLISHYRWMCLMPPSLPMLRQNIKPLSQFAKQELAPFALSTAVVGGAVAPERVEAVKKIYKLLELDVDNVYSDLHSYAIGNAATIVQPTSKTQKTLDIPQDSEGHLKFGLDFKRIDAVLSDTDRVASVLGEIFEDDSQVNKNEQSEEADGLLPGLDHQHALLTLELIQRDHWEDEEFEQLAGRFNLMPGGALENLNEWSFERFDEPLLEEYDGYNLNLDLVEKLETL